MIIVHNKQTELQGLLNIAIVIQNHIYIQLLLHIYSIIIVI